MPFISPPPSPALVGIDSEIDIACGRSFSYRFTPEAYFSIIGMAIGRGCHKFSVESLRAGKSTILPDPRVGSGFIPAIAFIRGPNMQDTYTRLPPSGRQPSGADVVLDVFNRGPDAERFIAFLQLVIFP